MVIEWYMSKLRTMKSCTSVLEQFFWSENRATVTPCPNVFPTTIFVWVGSHKTKLFKGGKQGRF